MDSTGEEYVQILSIRWSIMHKHLQNLQIGGFMEFNVAKDFVVHWWPESPDNN